MICLSGFILCITSKLTLNVIFLAKKKFSTFPCGLFCSNFICLAVLSIKKGAIKPNYSYILISCRPRPGLEDYETLYVHVCACMHVFVCHILKSSFISHSFMKISSPNLQTMFMAVKTCL